MTDFPIDLLHAVIRTDTRPAYAQIAEQLRRVIRDSKVEPGTQLPAEPELVQRFGVSRMTLREGIRVLRQEGALRAQHGVGVFVGEQRMVGRMQLGGATVRSEPAWREAVAQVLQARPHAEPVDLNFEMWAENVLERPKNEITTVSLRIEDLNRRPESITLFIPHTDDDPIQRALDALENAESWIVSVRAAGPGDGARSDSELLVTRIARRAADEFPLMAARSERAGTWAVTTIEAQ